jgi:hypothetical protein
MAVRMGLRIKCLEAFKNAISYLYDSCRCGYLDAFRVLYILFAAIFAEYDIPLPFANIL